MDMYFFNNVDPKLNQIIDHYWYLEGELEADFLYEVLPMDHSDLIINLEGHVAFIVDDDLISPSSIYFHGMKTSPFYLKQSGFSRSIGVSFKPWGLQSLLGQPMNTFKNKIVNIEPLMPLLFRELGVYGNRIKNHTDFNEKDIEAVLDTYIKIKEDQIKSVSEIRKFIDSGQTIDHYTKRHNISRRKLERDFSKYVGLSPSVFRQIQKFEFVSRELIFASNPDLSDLAYEGDYTDQPHFSKQFKKFSKKTPKTFIEKKTALKSKINFK